MTPLVSAIHRSLHDDDACADPVLLNDWHVVGFSRDLQQGAVASARFRGRDLVMWRDLREELHHRTTGSGSSIGGGLARSD